jgi:hypothetical protein
MLKMNFDNLCESLITELARQASGVKLSKRREKKTSEERSAAVTKTDEFKDVKLPTPMQGNDPEPLVTPKEYAEKAIPIIEDRMDKIVSKYSLITDPEKQKKSLAPFDVIINQSDRKAHCLNVRQLKLHFENIIKKLEQVAHGMTGVRNLSTRQAHGSDWFYALSKESTPNRWVMYTRKNGGLRAFTTVGASGEDNSSATTASSFLFDQKYKENNNLPVLWLDGKPQFREDGTPVLVSLKGDHGVQGKSISEVRKLLGDSEIENVLNTKGTAAFANFFKTKESMDTAAPQQAESRIRTNTREVIGKQSQAWRNINKIGNSSTNDLEFFSAGLGLSEALTEINLINQHNQ